MRILIYILLFVNTVASAQLPSMLPMRIGSGNIGTSYATWSATNKASVVGLSNGDLTAVGTSGNTGLCIATKGKSTGKWFWEVRVDIKQIGNNNELVGLTTIVPNSSNTQNLAGYPKQISRRGISWCMTYNIGSGVNYLYPSCTAQSSGEIITFALDLTAGTCTMFLNGVLAGTVSGITGGDTWYPAMCSDGASTSGKVTANFGQSPFTYTPASLGLSGYPDVGNAGGLY